MSSLTYLKLKLSNSSTWVVAKANIDFDGELFDRAVNQATIKSRYTMTSSQAGAYRSPEMKLQRQLMGCLAEIYVQEYLQEFLLSKGLQNKWTVVRYDDVRTDGFKSPKNEYDIKLIKSNNENYFTVESRSSITRDRSLEKGIESFDIIGPYVSVTKGEENYTNIYLRPLYEYTNFIKKDYSDLQFAELVKKGLINLYIVGGCLKEDMISRGYNKSMNQSGTDYRVLKIQKGYDAITFKDRLVRLLLQ